MVCGDARRQSLEDGMTLAGKPSCRENHVGTSSYLPPTTRGTSPQWFTMIICLLTSALLGIYSEMFYEYRKVAWLGEALDGGFILGTLSVSAVLHALLAAAVFLLLFALALAWNHRALRWLCDHRVIMGVGLIVACTALEVSGSSVGVLSEMVGDAKGSGLLFGIPRSIRSDEYIVQTPFAVSQQYTGYAAVSNLLQGTGADVTMVYAQPCWAIATLFRPFLWGYLVLGSTRGLAFFWAARLIVLALVSFEFGLLITRRNRQLSAAYMVLVSFSPTIQWWFAVNGIAELFIFGQGLVVALSCLLHAEGGREVWGWSALIAWMAGGYALVLYPAWQVPLFYIFAGCAVAVCVSVRRERRGALFPGRPLRHVVALGCCLGAMALLVGYSLYSVRDVIQTVSQTVYPGQRSDAGGGGLAVLLNSGASLIGPLNAEQMVPNACEASAFFSMFPAGVIMAIWTLTHQKRHYHDPFLVCLFVVKAFLAVYVITGFPEPLAKMTLMDRSLVFRTIQMIGFVDLVLLVRSLASPRAHAADRRSLPEVARVALAGCAGVLFTIVGKLVAGAYPTLATALPLRFAVYVALFSSVFAWSILEDASGRRRAAHSPLLVASSIVLLSGLLVNPVQQGIGPLADSSLASVVKKVESTDDSGLWIASSSMAGQGSMAGQICVAAGARTVNSVNTYPNLDLWASVDPSGSFKDIYNRYAHITVVPTHGSTTFTSRFPDSFEVSINPDDLVRLGVTYWVSPSDLTTYDTAATTFEPLETQGIWTVYRIIYH